MTATPLRGSAPFGAGIYLSCSTAALLTVLLWTGMCGLRSGQLDATALVGLRGLALAHQTAVGPLRAVMGAFTFLGAFPTLCPVLLAAAALLALDGAGREALTLVVASGTGIGAANMLKRIVDRPRPSLVEHWASFGSSSFPSGHAADSTIAYLLLAAVATRRIADPRVRGAAVAFLSCLPALVGFSRVFLGVHWPTDVLGGWAFGAAWTLMALRVMGRLDPDAIEAS